MAFLLNYFCRLLDIVLIADKLMCRVKATVAVVVAREASLAVLDNSYNDFPALTCRAFMYRRFAARASFPASTQDQRPEL
jgi:hypothetical protein